MLGLTLVDLLRAVGLILCTLGLRGRLIPAQAACRRCGHAALADAPICTECGGHLLGPGALRLFRRRPAWIALSLGATLLVADRVAPLGLAALGFAPTTRFANLASAGDASTAELIAEVALRGLDAPASIAILDSREPALEAEELRAAVAALATGIERGDRAAMRRLGVSEKAASLLAAARRRGLDDDAIERIAKTLFDPPRRLLPPDARADARRTHTFGGRTASGRLVRRSLPTRVGVDGTDVAIERPAPESAVISFLRPPGRYVIEIDFESRFDLEVSEAICPPVFVKERVVGEMTLHGEEDPSWIRLEAPEEVRSLVTEACTATVIAIDRLDDGSVALRTDGQVTTGSRLPLHFRAEIEIEGDRYDLGPLIGRGDLAVTGSVVLPDDPAPGAEQATLLLVPDPRAAESGPSGWTWGETIRLPCRIVRDRVAARPFRPEPGVSGPRSVR